MGVDGGVDAQGVDGRQQRAVPGHAVRTGLQGGVPVLAGPPVALLGADGVGLDHSAGDGLAGRTDGLLREPVDGQLLHPRRDRVVEVGGELGQDLGVHELDPPLRQQRDRAREPAHDRPRLHQPAPRRVRRHPQGARDLLPGLQEVHQRVRLPRNALQRLCLQPGQQFQLDGLQPAKVSLHRHQGVDPARRRQHRARQPCQPRRAVRTGHAPRQLRHHHVIHDQHPQTVPYTPHPHRRH